MLNPVQRVFNNAIHLIISRLSIGIVTVLTFSMFAKKLGVEEFGLLVFGITVAEIFSIVCDFGLSYMVVREIARGGKKSEFISNTLFIKIILNAIIYLLVLDLFYIFYDASTFEVLFWNLLYGLAYSTFLYFVGIFNGFQKMVFTSAMNSILAIFVSLGSLSIILLEIHSAIIISCYRFVVLFIILLFVIDRSYKLIPFTITIPNITTTLLLLKTILPFGIFFIGGILYMQVDNFIIKYYLGDIQVGIYQSAFKIVIFLETIPLMAANALYPSITTKIKESFKTAEYVIYQSTKLLFIIGCLIGLVFYIFASDIILFLYTNEYEESILLMKIFAFLIPLRFAGHIFGITITVADNQWGRMLTSVSATILNIILNIALIPVYGIFGSAVVSVITSIFTISIYSYLTKNVISIKPYKTIFIPIVFAFAAAIIGIIGLLSGVAQVLQIIIATFIYLGVLLLIKVINKNDLEFILRMIRTSS